MTVPPFSIEISEWAILSVFGPVLYWYVGVLWGRFYLLSHPPEVIIYENRSEEFSRAVNVGRARLAREATFMGVLWPVTAPSLLAAWSGVGLYRVAAWLVTFFFYDLIAGPTTKE